MAADWSEIVPPSNLTVTHDHKPVLYTPDDKVLVRQAGFTAGYVKRDTNPPRKTER